MKRQYIVGDGLERDWGSSREHWKAKTNCLIEAYHDWKSAEAAE
jgi:hypothetical protein